MNNYIYDLNHYPENTHISEIYKQTFPIRNKNKHEYAQYHHIPILQINYLFKSFKPNNEIFNELLRSVALTGDSFLINVSVMIIVSNTDLKFAIFTSNVSNKTIAITILSRNLEES